MASTLTDYNRRDANFIQPQVETIVPEHFKEQYPTLVTFIKKFYDYLEIAAGRNNLSNVFYVRDAESTSEDFLDYLFFESINGLGADFFKFPRLTLKFIPNFYPIKGTEISVPAFFRYIYGVDSEQFYPKTRIFNVGESPIGAESLRFIQDSNFYQILSIQIKSPLGITQWRDVYKRYNHPAGFALFAETLFEETATNSIMSAPLSIQDSAATAVTLEDFNVSTTSAFGTTTGIDSSLTSRFYVDRGIQFYQDSIGELTSAQKGEYTSIVDVLSTNSPRFSSNDSDLFSDSSLQTMDEDIFEFYADSGLDSA
ncbi:MAG: hypothetical protein ACPGGA_06680 [Balneolaceae bacterium]